MARLFLVDVKDLLGDVMSLISPVASSRCKHRRATSHIYYSGNHDFFVTFGVVLLLLQVLGMSVTAAYAHSTPLSHVKFWAYQIQSEEVDGNLQKLADSLYDLLVIDDLRSVQDEESFDMKSNISMLHSSLGSQGQPKLVLAYMDIGEAEGYRWYWQANWTIGNPDWIVAADPEGWADNYPVLFWRSEWKSILFGYAASYLDKVMADGFDGVYLDWIEAATFEPVVSAAVRENKNPRAEMIALVAELAAYARAQKPSFLVVPQNALDLARPQDAITRRYLDTIDAIAQEAVWYDGTSEQIQGDLPSSYTEELLHDLAIFQGAGKSVFTVDYAQQSEHVAYAYAQAEAHGFIEYVTLRELDKLSATPPPTYPIPEFKETIMMLAIAVLITAISRPKRRTKTKALYPYVRTTRPSHSTTTIRFSPVLRFVLQWLWKLLRAFYPLTRVR